MGQRSGTSIHTIIEVSCRSSECLLYYVVIHSIAIIPGRSLRSPYTAMCDRKRSLDDRIRSKTEIVYGLRVLRQ